MKTKTISAVLNKKFNEWANSIKDESVKSLVMKNTIITGGSIASMLLKEDVNDFDVYFKDKQTTLAVAQYYVSEFLTAYKFPDEETEQLKEVLMEMSADIQDLCGLSFNEALKKIGKKDA